MAKDNNLRGFHHPESQHPDHNKGGASHMAPGGGKHKHMSEPTNHAGHTHEMARRHEHDARVEATRGIHTGKQMDGHERILHESHKLHQHDGHISHGTKHGEAHHIRNEERGESKRTQIKERGEELD